LIFLAVYSKSSLSSASNAWSSANCIYEISGSHGGEYEDYRAFSDAAPCSLVVDRRFRGLYCLHH
jgi:hypothetical protein